MTMTYTIYGSGDIIVEYTLTPDASMSEIPNVGTLFTIPGGLEKIRWYGKGPYENYVGRNQGSYFGVYSSIVDSMTVFYMENGETGQRTNVKWMTLTNSAGTGLMIAGSPLMEINAQHYTPQQLTEVKLPWDLKRDKDITLRVDLQQMGLGGINSWGAKPLDKYLIFPKNTYSHKFRISPVRGKLDDPSVLANLGFKNLQTDPEKVKYPDIPYIEQVQSAYKLNAIPGVIEAENFDIGGEGLAYHDADVGNQGGVYREDEDVDIVGDSIKGYGVGYTEADEWLEYTVNLASAGTYYFRAAISSGAENSSFRLFLDGKAITDTLVVPQGKDWDTYVALDGKTAELSAGKHVLKIAITGNYVNLDRIEFSEKPVSVTGGISGTPAAIEQTYRIYNINGAFLGAFDAGDIASLRKKLSASDLKAGVYMANPVRGGKRMLVEIKK